MAQKSESTITLDKTDRQLLQLLQQNARMPNTELANAVGLTPAPCLRRIKRLEDLGLISHYAAILDHHKLGQKLTVFVMVTLDKQTKNSFDDFAATMRKHSEVQECHLMLGERDFLLKVLTTDLDSYQHFYLNHLTVAKGVRNIQSIIAVRTEKNTSDLGLG